MFFQTFRLNQTASEDSLDVCKHLWHLTSCRWTMALHGRKLFKFIHFCNKLSTLDVFGVWSSEIIWVLVNKLAYLHDRFLSDFYLYLISSRIFCFFQRPDNPSQRFRWFIFKRHTRRDLQWSSFPIAMLGFSLTAATHLP